MLTSLATLAPTLAQHTGDIVLTIDAGRIVTGSVVQGVHVPNTRVFPVALGVDFANFASSPGYDCMPGTFGYPGAIGFRIHGRLLEWAGAGFVTPVDGERIEVAFGSLATLTPTNDSTVDGFTLNIGSNGEWHRHLEYTLLAPAGDGVYLMELTLFQTPSSTNAAGESEPFWLVFDQNASTGVVDSAMQWALDNLVNPPPACPADFNDDTTVDVADLFAYINAWLAKSTAADFNDDATIDVADLFAYINAWLAKC